MTADCPTCGGEFDTERGMKVHHSKAHGEPLRDTTTCNHCGGEFEIDDPTKPNNYCSRECTNKSKRDRVEITCENCDQSFEVPKSASHRRFCSKECQLDNHHTMLSCEACGRSFKVPNSKPRKYCCRTCAKEYQNDRPRPDDLEMLLWLLYVYEGYQLREVFRRQRAIFGHDNCLTTDEVRGKLDEMGVKQQYNSARWTLLNTDPDEVGGSKPDGNESWKQHYLMAES